MKVHKKIKINKDKMEKAIQHDDLIRRARHWITDYNRDKDKEIIFTYTGNNSKAIEWGYLQTCDIDWLDSYFVGVLGMKAITKSTWDNKTADRIYFFER